MLAVKARVENGSLEWLEKPPVIGTEVLVIFSDEVIQSGKLRKKMSDMEALRILDKYAGSIDREIDYEKERDKYFNEKYGSLN